MGILVIDSCNECSKQIELINVPSHCVKEPVRVPTNVLRVWTIDTTDN